MVVDLLGLFPVYMQHLWSSACPLCSWSRLFSTSLCSVLVDLLTVQNDGGHQAAGNLSVQQNLSKSFQAAFIQPFFRALTRIVLGGNSYRRACVFPNNVQSTEFTPGGLQPRCRNIKETIKRKRKESVSRKA